MYETILFLIGIQRHKNPISFKSVQLHYKPVHTICCEPIENKRKIFFNVEFYARVLINVFYMFLLSFSLTLCNQITHFNRNSNIIIYRETQRNTITM